MISAFAMHTRNKKRFAAEAEVDEKPVMTPKSENKKRFAAEAEVVEKPVMTPKSETKKRFAAEAEAVQKPVMTPKSETKKKPAAEPEVEVKPVFKTPKLETLPAKRKSIVVQTEPFLYESTPKEVAKISKKPVPKNRTSPKDPISPRRKVRKNKSENKPRSATKTKVEVNGNGNHVVNADTDDEIMSDSESQNGGSSDVSNSSFCWLLGPVSQNAFYKEYFDEKPLHISRSNPGFYQGLFSTEAFDKIMKENNLKYDTEIDIVACIGGERTPVTNDTSVRPSFVWDSYSDGYSIRMRNPQVYNKALWALCSMLQEHFSSFVGANMYLTPAGAQGFPAHYDDIDAFILQIEGRKNWRVYKPHDDDMLARFSSPDLKDEDIGDPVMELVLEQGDLLYLPRGYIHQAMTMENEHSLHITLSTNQLNTWGDMLQQGISDAVETAMKIDVEFRRSVPRNYMDIAGTSFADTTSSERTEFTNKFRYLAFKAMNFLNVDTAADVHATRFIHESMPPVFNKSEGDHSIHGNGTRIENGELKKAEELTLDTKIRFIRKRAFRLVMDDDNIRLFYSLDNSKNCKEEDAKYLDVDMDVVPAINHLFKTYPEFVAIRKLPSDFGNDIKLAFTQQLYDNGFLMTEKPLPGVRSMDF